MVVSEQEMLRGGNEEVPQALARRMDTRVIQVDVAVPLEFVQDLFLSMGLRYILVVRKSRLVGIIKKKDLIHHIAFSHKRDRQVVH
eukprot:172265-Hanusia_phi.AAC.2